MPETTADIRFTVVLDEQRRAERIEWEATESDMPGPQPCEAFTVSVWNERAQDTLGIDLWTKYFPVRSMRLLVGQTLIRLGATFARATQDEALGKRIQDLGGEVLATADSPDCLASEPFQKEPHFNPPLPDADSFGVELTLGVDGASGETISTVLNRPGSAPHVAIMGRNGSGKTRTALTYLEKIVNTVPYNIPFLIFDYAKGDIAGNADFIQSTDAKVVTLPIERLPLSPLALDVADEHAIKIAAYRFRDTLMSVVRNLGPKQKSRCLDLIRQAYKEIGPDRLSLNDVASKAVQTYENNDWSEDSLIAVLKELADFPLFQSTSLSGRHPLYSQSHVIDVHSLPDDLRKLAVFLTLDRLYSEIMAADDAPLDADGNRLIRFIIVIDEAHHYLACRQPTLEKMIREVRSKGVGIWLLSQSPDDFEQPRYNFSREIGLAIVFSCVLERPKMLEAILGAKVSPQQLAQLPIGAALTRVAARRHPVQFLAWRP